MVQDAETPDRSSEVVRTQTSSRTFDVGVTLKVQGETTLQHTELSCRP